MRDQAKVWEVFTKVAAVLLIFTDFNWSFLWELCDDIFTAVEPHIISRVGEGGGCWGCGVVFYCADSQSAVSLHSSEWTAGATTGLKTISEKCDHSQNVHLNHNKRVFGNWVVAIKIRNQLRKTVGTRQYNSNLSQPEWQNTNHSPLTSKLDSVF